MRLLAITAATLLIVAMSLSTIHYWGLSQRFEPYDNGFYKFTTPWIIVPAGQINGKPTDFIGWIDVDEDTIARAAEILKENPKNRFILNVTKSTDRIDEKVASILTDKENGRVLIESPFDVVMSSIKTLKPLLVYGSSQADQMRFRVFESLGVLTAAPFKGDAYVGSITLQKVPLFDENIALELKRRFKKIILGPLTNSSDVAQALRLDVDGIYVSDTQLILDATRR
jgi:hypothetical protein